MPWAHTFPAPLPLTAGCVAALGNFDGVHQGHLSLLQYAKAQAQALALPLVALTFDPHPRSILRPEIPLQQLQTLPARLLALHQAGAEGVAVLPFNGARAQQSPADFIEEILIGWLQAKAVVIGENFKFGHRAAGTPTLLQQQPQFQTHVVALVGDAVGPFSSTRLRLARQ